MHLVSSLLVDAVVCLDIHVQQYGQMYFVLYYVGIETRSYFKFTTLYPLCRLAFKKYTSKTVTEPGFWAKAGRLMNLHVFAPKYSVSPKFGYNFSRQIDSEAGIACFRSASKCVFHDIHVLTI